MKGETAATAERRKSLEGILASRTFRRAEVLKRLLSYLVEQEETGRAVAITEYELGVNALGRPKDFSPETDSSVRTRIHALRQKLEEYYRDEDPGSELLLSLPRGSYIPQFVARPPVPISLSPEFAKPPQLQAGRPKSKPWGWIAAGGVLAGVAVLLAVGWLQPGPRWRTSPAIRSLWKPILDSNQSAVIAVAQPVHVWIRDMRNHPNARLYQPFSDPPPNSDGFLRYYQKRAQILPESRLVIHPSPNATLWGDAAGAGLAAKFLSAQGVESETIPEGTLASEAAIRHRPLLVFGRPEFSRVADRYLQVAGGYTVGMIPEIREFAIYRPDAHSDRFLNTAEPNELNYGLITVLTESSGDSARRVMLFSGITSDGSMAGIEYLTNGAAVSSLWDRLRREGLTAWPRVFQVIVRTSSSVGYAMNVSYEKHLVLQR